MDKDTLFVLKIIFAIILPPLALYDKGLALIVVDIVLCFLAWIPAVILALFVVLKDRGVI